MRTSDVRLPPFQVVLDAHRDALWRFVVAHVGPDDGPDCLQEALLAALRAYPRLPADADVRAWLFTIAVRKAIDVHRARRRRPVPVGEGPDRPAPPPAVEGEPALWAAVRALPPKQRTAVVARYVGDLPYVRVAEVVGCSEEAARQNVRAGLRRLREVLG